MNRLESSAFDLAAGGATIFALAVVLSGGSRSVAIVVVALAVGGWSMRAPVVAGPVLAVIAWLVLTGFDVHAHGTLRVTGRLDVVRFAVLAGAALAGAAIGRLGSWSHGAEEIAEAYGDPVSGVSPEVRWTVPRPTSDVNGLVR